MSVDFKSWLLKVKLTSVFLQGIWEINSMRNVSKKWKNEFLI